MYEQAMALTEQEKEKIINDTLPFIKITAYRMSHRLPPQLSMSDLISVGVVGLLDALQRYSASRAKLNTFVEHRIRGAMLDELRAQDWVSRTVKAKIGQIQKAHADLEQAEGRAPTDEEVAAKVGLPMDEYYRTVESASNAVIFSFEDFRDRMSDQSDVDISECIPDPDMKTPLEQLEESSTKEELAAAITSLAEKEKLVLSLYYWEELTMKEIGKVMSLTEGRVCQLHNSALIKLRAKLKIPVAV